MDDKAEAEQKIAVDMNCQNFKTIYRQIRTECSSCKVIVAIGYFPWTALRHTRKCGRHEELHIFRYTGRERLIRSHSSARFCFELSGNSN